MAHNVSDLHFLIMESNPELVDALEQIARTGRWGTCRECPRGDAGRRFPEICDHTDRSDHHRSLDELTELYNIELEKFRLQQVKAS